MSSNASADCVRDARPVAGDARVALTQHHAEAWRWASACCGGDRHAAHDVLHDAYERILAGRAVFAGRSSFKTWLFGVVRFTAMSTRRRRLFMDMVLEPIGPLSERVPTPMPAERAPRRLMQALSALPRRQCEVVTLVFAHDLTIEEAAAVMKISVGAARQHHARAKAKLRAVLSPNQENSHG